MINFEKSKVLAVMKDFGFITNPKFKQSQKENWQIMEKTVNGKRIKATLRFAPRINLIRVSLNSPGLKCTSSKHYSEDKYSHTLDLESRLKNVITRTANA